jgi:hypothetical protein
MTLRAVAEHVRQDTLFKAFRELQDLEPAAMGSDVLWRHLLAETAKNHRVEQLALLTFADALRDGTEAGQIINFDLHWMRKHAQAGSQ